MTIVTLSETPVAASTMIARAMRLIGQISPGVDPTVDEYATCLDSMNTLLDAWRNEKLMCTAMLDENFQLVAAQPSYTVGSGMDLNTNRPVKIDQAYVVVDGISHTLRQWSAEEYAAIVSKGLTSPIPQGFYYAPDMPAGNIWIYPIPSAGSTLHVLTWTPQMSFATSATTAYLAPGWKQAIETNLAIEIAPEFDMEASQTVTRMAMKAKAGIKTVNAQPIMLETNLPLNYGNRYNIYSDQ